MSDFKTIGYIVPYFGRLPSSTRPWLLSGEMNFKECYEHTNIIYCSAI